MANIDQQACMLLVIEYGFVETKENDSNEHGYPRTENIENFFPRFFFDVVFV